jgi:hypothetical protein
MGFIKSERKLAKDAHHDLAEFALGDITQLDFLHGHGLSGCPVERAWNVSSSALSTLSTEKDAT